MKKTFREKILKKLKSEKNKKSLSGIYRIPCYCILLFLNDLIMRISLNSKRLLGIGSLGFVFVLTSSFTGNSTGDSGIIKIIYEEPVANDYNLETTTDDNTTKLLDDDDVKESEDEIYQEFEEEDLENIDNIDVFSVDEILESNQSDSANDIAEIDSEETQDIMQDDELVANILNTVTFDKEDWKLVLINKQHPVPDDYEFTLGTIKGSMQCDERIIADLLAMLQAAKDDGVNLLICSPFRDYNYQTILFNRKIDAYMSRGNTYLEAYSLACQTVTVPGASEHQIGLALDIVSDTYSSLNAGFGDTAAGKWLYENSCKYGFILRYPEGKEDVTGIEYEPWHYRYVGVDAAIVIMKTNITLEEFIDQLP